MLRCRPSTCRTPRASALLPTRLPPPSSSSLLVLLPPRPPPLSSKLLVGSHVRKIAVIFVVAVVVGVVVGEDESPPDLAYGLPTSRLRRCRQRSKRGVDGLETAKDARRTPHEAFKGTPWGAIKLRFTNFALVSVLPESGRTESQRKVLRLPCGAY